MACLKFPPPPAVFCCPDIALLFLYGAWQRLRCGSDADGNSIPGTLRTHPAAPSAIRLRAGVCVRS